MGRAGARPLAGPWHRKHPAWPRAGVGLWAELARVALGVSKVEAQRGDWRFADPAWNDNPGYQRLKQAYLAWSEAMLSSGRGPEGGLAYRRAGPVCHDGHDVGCCSEQLLPLNPAALKRAFDTGGKSVARGLRSYLQDLRRNGGMPAQVQEGAFKVGNDLAVTPGAVVWRDERCELIRYAPTHPDGAIPPGRGGHAPDQQVLLPGPGPGSQLCGVRGQSRRADFHRELAQSGARTRPLGPRRVRHDRDRSDRRGPIPHGQRRRGRRSASAPGESPRRPRWRTSPPRRPAGQHGLVLGDAAGLRCARPDRHDRPSRPHADVEVELEARPGC